jgi:hypothetical protein
LENLPEYWFREASGGPQPQFITDYSQVNPFEFWAEHTRYWGADTRFWLSRAIRDFESGLPVLLNMFLFIWEQPGPEDTPSIERRALMRLGENGLLEREFIPARWLEGDATDGIFQFTFEGATYDAIYRNRMIWELKRNGITVKRENTQPALEYQSVVLAVSGLTNSFSPAVFADPDLDKVEFKLLLAPVGAAIDSSSGVVSWLPEATQLTTNLFVVSATDSGKPKLETIAVFSVGVRNPPNLHLAATYDLQENQSLTISNFLAQADLNADVWTIDLSRADDRLRVRLSDDRTAIVAEGSEAAGPGEYELVLKIASENEPRLAATKVFVIRVAEVNSLPALAESASRALYPGESLTVTNSATDHDLPANSISYRLDGPSHGAQLEPQTGIFAWKPDVSLPAGIYTFQITASDDGTPSLTDTKLLSVELRKAPELSIQHEGVHLKFQLRGAEGRTFQIEATRDFQTWSQVAAGSAQSATDGVLLPIDSASPNEFYRLVITR